LNIEEIDLGLASQVIASSNLKNIDLLLAIDSDVSQFYLGATKTDYCQLDSECFKILEEGH
jgi:hypothetical protein